MGIERVLQKISCKLKPVLAVVVVVVYHWCTTDVPSVAAASLMVFKRWYLKHKITTLHTWMLPIAMVALHDISLVHNGITLKLVTDHCRVLYKIWSNSLNYWWKKYCFYLSHISEPFVVDGIVHSIVSGVL